MKGYFIEVYSKTRPMQYAKFMRHASQLRYVSSVHGLTGALDFLVELTEEVSAEELITIEGDFLDSSRKHGFNVAARGLLATTVKKPTRFSDRQGVKCFVFVRPELFIDEESLTRDIGLRLKESCRGAFIVQRLPQELPTQYKVLIKLEVESVERLATVLFEELPATEKVADTETCVVLRVLQSREPRRTT